MAPVLIHTDRLWLRPFARADVDALHAIFVTPEVRRYLLDGNVVPRSWVEEVIAESERDFDASAGLFCVALERCGPPVGFTGYREFHEPPVRELLYGLAPGSWGRGLASEAAHAAARYGFEHLGLDPIRATVDAPNEASIRLILGLGFRESHRDPAGPEHVFEQVHFEREREGFPERGGRFEVIEA